MKKSITGFMSYFAAILVLLTLSCSMDLEPAKAGDTSVSFTVGTLLPPANALVLPDSPAARAVAPGTGYLYIRTLGGPTGDKGPFYGPFTLASGDTFTTTDIPAGTYQAIGVLYATEPLDDLTAVWNDQTRTFAELMRLPDSEFALFSDGPAGSEEPSTFDLLIGGRASGKMLSPVTIAANKNNPLSLTLVPICGPSSITMSEIPEDNIYTETGDPDRIIRKFIELDGIVLPADYTGNLTCTISASGAPWIGRVAMFDEDGIQVGTTAAINTTLAADTDVSVSWTGGETYYLYIEYRAATLSLAFSTDLEPVVVEEGFITFNIAEGTPNAKVLAGISPYTGEGTEEQPAVAVAVMTLDGTGSGSAQFVDIETGEPYQFPTGQWFLNGFIDVNGNYSDITAGEPLVSTLGIEPHYGDLTFEGLLPATDGTNLNLPVISEFDTENTYIYYISQTGTGDGQRVATAMNPFAFGQILASGTSRSIRAYIVDNITFSSQNDLWTIDNGDDVDLTSLDPTQPETIAINVAGVFQVNEGGILRLSNVIIDGNNVINSGPFLGVNGTCTISTGTTIQNLISTEGFGAIWVDQGGYLRMTEGALISGCSGGVYLYNTESVSLAELSMEGGTITGCSRSGISISGYASATLSGGIIENCIVDGLGGGVYVSGDTGPGATLSLSGVIIRNCEASSGGGVYLNGADNYTTFTITGGTIRNCTAGYGGGISAYGSYVTIDMSGGAIENCVASTYGGGIALASDAKLQLSGSALITTTNPEPPAGWGLYCDYGGSNFITPTVPDLMDFFSPQEDFFMEPIG